MDVNMEKFTMENVAEFIKNNVDAVLIVDSKADTFKSIFRKGMFESFIEDSGSYTNLIEKLWFHFNETMDKITEDYQVFIPGLIKREIVEITGKPVCSQDKHEAKKEKYYHSLSIKQELTATVIIAPIRRSLSFAALTR